MTIHARPALLSAALLLFAACSDAPKKERAKEPEAPAEPVTGRQAFQSMFPAARAWALDALPLQLRSIDLQEVKSGQGRAGAWQGIFVSAAKGRSRNYTYSAVEAPGNLHKGVFAGPDESWTGRSGQASPFEIAAIKFDSDQAYETAVQKSADYIKRNADKPVTFLLEETRRFPDLAWRVVWGESVGASDYSVFVDATTGKFLEKAH